MLSSHQSAQYKYAFHVRFNVWHCAASLADQGVLLHALHATFIAHSLYKNKYFLKKLNIYIPLKV